jgi:hypothetical protein
VSVRAISPTRFGSAYYHVLVLAVVCALIGAADAGRVLFWGGLPLLAGGDVEMRGVEIVHASVRLAAWSILGCIAYYSRSRRVFPPPWAAVVLAIMMWLVLLT